MVSKPRPPARHSRDESIRNKSVKNEDSLLYPLIESYEEEDELEVHPAVADLANLDLISGSSSVSGKSDEDTAYSKESSTASYASVKVHQTKLQKIKTAAGKSLSPRSSILN